MDEVTTTGPLYSENPRKERENTQLSMAAVLVQEILGVKAQLEAISIIRKNQPKRDSTIIRAIVTLADGRKTGLMDLGICKDTREEIEIFSHEATHLVLLGEKRDQTLLEQAVEDGVADLVGLETADRMLNEMRKGAEISARKSFYQRVCRDKEAEIREAIPLVGQNGPPRIIVVAEGEGPYHLLGRNFVFSLSEYFPDVSIATLRQFFLEKPPDLEDLFTPEKYIRENSGKLCSSPPVSLTEEAKKIFVYETERRRLF